MQKLKPEEDAIKEQYAGDPMAINRARQELYRKHGYKMGGYCLFMMINLVLTILIFFSVFSALRGVADYNVKIQVQELQGIYRVYTNPEHENYAEMFGTLETDEEKQAEFTRLINETYGKHAVGFLWIKNIWKADTPWTNSGLTPNDYMNVFDVPSVIADDDPGFLAAQVAYPDKIKTKGDYYKSLSKADKKVVNTAAQTIAVKEFAAINGALDIKYKRKWNGLLFLIILAGATTWGSVYINAKMMGKKKEAEAPKEAAVQYSMRNAKTQRDGTPAKPAMDPAMANKMMKFILPAVMVLFTMSSTAALAIYIITSGLLTTGINLALTWPVKKLVDWDEARRKKRQSAPPDPTVINPHAKYFKNIKRGG
jgi:membrane protein insertase Oxa1/YidC/SpoIIIJ